MTTPDNPRDDRPREDRPRGTVRTVIDELLGRNDERRDDRGQTPEGRRDEDLFVPGQRPADDTRSPQEPGGAPGTGQRVDAPGSPGSGPGRPAGPPPYGSAPAEGASPTAATRPLPGAGPVPGASPEGREPASGTAPSHLGQARPGTPAAHGGPGQPATGNPPPRSTPDARGADFAAPVPQGSSAPHDSRSEVTADPDIGTVPPNGGYGGTARPAAGAPDAAAGRHSATPVPGAPGFDPRGPQADRTGTDSTRTDETRTDETRPDAPMQGDTTRETTVDSTRDAGRDTTRATTDPVRPTGQDTRVTADDGTRTGHGAAGTTSPRPTPGDTSATEPVREGTDRTGTADNGTSRTVGAAGAAAAAGAGAAGLAAGAAQRSGSDDRTTGDDRRTSDDRRTADDRRTGDDLTAGDDRAAATDPGAATASRTDDRRTDAQARPDTTPSGTRDGSGTGNPPTRGTDSTGAERLVTAERAQEYATRWDQVKGSFVDEPRDAVTQADALVGELLNEMQRLFDEQRRGLEKGLDSDQTSTEDLRLALRRYRSFFDRLLSI